MIMDLDDGYIKMNKKASKYIAVSVSEETFEPGKYYERVTF
jgi:hypothetical protein